MNLFRRRVNTHKISYAQCGEDLIVDFIFSGLKPRSISYLDIGAHHPTHLSNTYLFYQKGLRGVCVEPDVSLFHEIRRVRKRDLCLNVGVGVGGDATADFYVMGDKALNTFSRDEAMRNEQERGQKIEQVISLPLLPVNDVIRQHFASPPNFISLDVEGLDLEVLQSFDFELYRPQIFCVETLTYVESGIARKITEISDLMMSKGYFAYADTYVNTIFVDQGAWANRS